MVWTWSCMGSQNMHSDSGRANSCLEDGKGNGSMDRSNWELSQW